METLVCDAVVIETEGAQDSVVGQGRAEDIDVVVLAPEACSRVVEERGVTVGCSFFSKAVDISE